MALLAIGSMVYPALEAAEALHELGVEASVVNARFCKPIDTEMILKMAAKTGRIVTIEEGALQGGYGAAVLETLADHGAHHVKVKRLGIPDRFIEHAEHQAQLAEVGLTPEGILRAALELVGAQERAATGRS